MWSQWKHSIQAWSQDSDGFLRVFSVLSSSTLLVHLINLFAYPLVARLYSPEFIGQRVLFVGIASILVIYVSWGYEIAVNTPKEQQDAQQLTAGALGIVLLNSLVVLSFIALFPFSFYESVGWASLWTYRFFLPLACLFGGAFRVLNHWMLRKEAYPLIARTKIYRNLTKAAIEITGGLLYPQTYWLVGAWLLGGFSSALRFAWLFFKQTFSWSAIWSMLRKYRRFPQFQLASNFLYVFHLQLPLLMISWLFSDYELGQYAMSMALFGVASAVVVESYSNYHLVQFSKMVQHQERHWRDYFWKMLARALFLGLSIGMMIILFGPWAVKILLGAQWEMAGQLFQILSILFGSLLIYSFNFHVFTQLDYQWAQLVFNLIKVVLLLTIFWMYFQSGTWTILQIIIWVGLLDWIMSGLQSIFSYFILQTKLGR